jgi:hypothetical protein
MKDPIMTATGSITYWYDVISWDALRRSAGVENRFG